MCNECGECFGNYAKLKYHQHKVHKIRNLVHKCKFCVCNSNATNQLLQHERSHTGEKPEICQWFGKGFAMANTRMRGYTLERSLLNANFVITALLREQDWMFMYRPIKKNRPRSSLATQIWTIPNYLRSILLPWRLAAQSDLTVCLTSPQSVLSSQLRLVYSDTGPASL